MPKLSKVQSGKPWRPNAHAHNAFVDVANAFRATKFGASPAFGATVSLVKNTTGGDVPRGGVLAVDGVLFDTTDNEQDFWANNIVLKGTTPVAGTHTGNFVITASIIEAGGIGPCYTSGVCPVLVEVDETWHKFIDIKATVDEAKTYPGGGAYILDMEAGTGVDKWAVVRFGTVPHVICSFDLDSAITTSDSTKTADIETCTVPQYVGENITVTNATASSNKIFEGDAGDYGFAYYEPDENVWRMFQMEC